jgi:hypothetical protein
MGAQGKGVDAHDDSTGKERVGIRMSSAALLLSAADFHLSHLQPQSDFNKVLAQSSRPGPR